MLLDICYEYVPTITVNRVEYNPTLPTISNQKSTNLVKKAIGWK